LGLNVGLGVVGWAVVRVGDGVRVGVTVRVGV